MDHAGGAWFSIDYEEAWTPFDAQFEFQPDHYERQKPAIRLPDRALVIDLCPVYDSEGPRFAAGFDAINAAALRAFVWLAEDQELVALDWQHECFRYSPAAQALSGEPWRITVAPAGDYYAHMTADLQWGTFGHPWQQTLTIWGDALIDSLGAGLLTWLPRHPQTTA